MSGLAAVGFLLFGRHLSSYVRTSISLVTDSVKQAVPLDFEINRARNEVKNIMPEIRKNMQTIAKEEVEVDRLQQEIGAWRRSKTRIAPI